MSPLLWRLRVPAAVLALLVLFSGAAAPGNVGGQDGRTGSASVGEPVPAAAAGAPGWRLRARVWRGDHWSRTLPVPEALRRARARAWDRGRAGIRLVRVMTPVVLSGSATWYSLPGRTTACGEVMDPGAMTAASRDFPCGTWLVVRYGGRDVLVRVNDYGPATYTGHVLDLSLGAFERLAPSGAGVIAVEVRGP